jgi:uncharacterized membrane protein YdjX (TVP38/TMEM64 family)
MQRSVSARARQLPSSRAALIRIGSLVALLVVAALVAYELGWFDYRHTLEHVARLQKSHSIVGFTIGFIVVYGLGTCVGMPGLPFTVAAGALFGTLLGTALAWAGSLLSAVVGYWIARTVGHDVVVRWLKRFKRADAAVADARDFAGMLRLRLIPVLPLGTVNFVAGLARAPFVRYMLATAIGIVPATAIYCYFADSLVEDVGGGRSAATRSLIIATVLLILLSLTPKFFNRSNRSTGSTVVGPDFASGAEPGRDEPTPVTRS